MFLRSMKSSILPMIVMEADSFSSQLLSLPATRTMKPCTQPCALNYVGTELARLTKVTCLRAKGAINVAQVAGILEGALDDSGIASATAAFYLARRTALCRGDRHSRSADR